MLPLDVIVPLSAPRAWQAALIRRLVEDGHDVAVRAAGSPRWPGAVDALLSLEWRAFGRSAPGLAARCAIAERPAARPARLRLDLAGHAPPSATPTLTLRFDGGALDLAAAVAVAAGRLPAVEAVLDGGTVVGRALPMIDRRFSTALGLEDVLARAVTLAAATVRAFAGDRLEDMGRAGMPEAAATGFAAAWLTRALPRLGREVARRARFRHAHWNVGYRFIDGPGVAETGTLGAGWTRLAAPAGRFYADPFPFHWRDRPFLFVEDYVHAAGKAVVSVVPFDAAGRPLPPRVVLEEPHHLSYPQVFVRDGEVWMLPEASAGGRLTLYRAVDFPDRWQAAAVLLEGEISDATLLEHGGRLWLFATGRDGFGSTSDTLAVFHAPALAGPWRPHPLNPILIDRRMARPGGAFLRDREGRVLLPVQDGTEGYGGGLGLCTLLALDERTVRLSPPRPVAAGGDWPHPQVHTLNRDGRLEVIDGIAAQPRWSAGE